MQRASSGQAPSKWGVLTPRVMAPFFFFFQWKDLFTIYFDLLVSVCQLVVKLVESHSATNFFLLQSKSRFLFVVFINHKIYLTRLVTTVFTSHNLIGIRVFNNSHFQCNACLPWCGALWYYVFVLRYTVPWKWSLEQELCT